MATTQPLTADIESGNAEALEAAGVEQIKDPEAKGALKPIAETTFKERVAGLVAIGAVGTALVAIIVEQSTIVLVAGVLSSLMGPFAYYQQTKLTDIQAIQETAAKVQEEVDQLKEENDRLTHNIDDLGNTIEDLQDVEEALEVISKTQGQSVEALEKQVAENKNILNQMKKSTKGRVIQNLVSVISRGDEDMDNKISEDEATNVINGLSKIGGLRVNEAKLRKAIVGKEIDSVIMVVKNLLDEDGASGDRIFEIEE